MSMIILFLISAALLFQPFPVRAAEFDYDVTITPGTVAFFPNELYVGEPVRMYANIMNLGNKDITGVVGFYQGPNLLAPPHPFSLRAQSVTEDVWIDWTPTEGRYNIMVKIDTVPNDQNPGNNVYLTPMLIIAKRPPPPPPPPPPVQQQSIHPTNIATPKTNSTKQTIQQSTPQANVAKIVAQKISETLTPKLPLNPSISRKKIKVAEKPLSLQQTVERPGVIAQGSQSAPRGAVLGERAFSELVPVGTIEETVQSEKVKNDRALTEGLPQRKQSDLARMLLVIGILIAAASLGVGGYFLHKSRA